MSQVVLVRPDQKQSQVVVSFVNSLKDRGCTLLAAACLEVGSSVRASTGVVILFKVRLEGRGAGAVLWLLSKRGSSVHVEVVVVGSDLALSLLHAPEDKGNTTEKESTANATDNTADDLLVRVAQATAAVVAA